MLDIKFGMRATTLLENGRTLCIIQEERGNVPGFKRFKQVVENYNIWDSGLSKGTMVKMPAAVGDTIRRTGIGSNMTVLEHGLLVEIDGKPQWLNVAECEALKIECDRQEESARMQRLFGGNAK